MAKYRIIKREYEDKSVAYVIQRKSFLTLFMWSQVPPYIGSEIHTAVHSTLEKAIHHLNHYDKARRRDTVVL